MLFAHLADTHLGYRQYNLDEREEDFYLRFHEVVDKIISAECKFVVHSGDLFDSPRPHIRAMLEAMKALDRLSDEGIKVFAIAGNHDVLLRRGAIPPHRLYRNIEFLTPRNPSRVFRGVYVCGLPYHSKIHAKALVENLKALAEKAASYEKRILLMHQGIDKYFPLEHEIKIGDLPRGFHYYALGHIHKRILDDFGGGVIAYPGSTEMWRIDELRDWKSQGKGFYIVDTDEFGVKKIDLKIRPFIKAEVSSIDDIPTIKKMINTQRRPVVRLTVSAEPHEYNRLYQDLLRELSKTLYLDIQRKRTESEVEIEEKPISLRELIAEAMEDHPGLERDFAYALFEALSTGNIDSARNTVKVFYDTWAPAPKKKKESSEKKNARLEAYR